MRGQRVIFRNGPESLGRSSSPTRSGEGVSALSGGIDCAFLAVVVVVVIVVVVMSEMGMNVIDDWRRKEDFTTLLRARP
jgi:hypothetical protein